MSSYKKYKLRVEFQKDADLLFSAINAFVDEWTVVPTFCFADENPKSIRNAWMDNEVTFTVADDLTLPMMRWVLTKLIDLHVAAETIELFENYTGERVYYDNVVTEEPSHAVWQILQHCLEHAAEFWEDRSVELREAAIAFAVPTAQRTNRRLRSTDKHVDACLKRIFDENRCDKDNLAREIINVDINQQTLQSFFIGEVSGKYYDGRACSLYLNRGSNILCTVHELSSNTRYQFDDSSFVEIYMVSGHFNGEEKLLYTEGDSLDDFGYDEWLGRIEERIAVALAN